MKTLLCCIIAVLAAGYAQAAGQADRFVQKLKLSGDQTAVVAEGDLEARSIGSYSVRVYSSENAQPGDDTTFFLAGVVRERDGAVESIALADVNGDKRDELVVTIRSVGTGSYLSAHAYTVGKAKITLAAAVADLPAGTDPVAALRKAAKKHK